MRPDPADLAGEDLRRWLARPVLQVAPQLLDAHLSRTTPEGTVTVRLTEVEAYDGEADPGSHAFRGRTLRNEVMFGPAGHLYVYRHMGLHHCANVVTGDRGRASAVLLRAGEVVEGVDLAARRRQASGVSRSPVDLAQGPARLVVALGIDLRHAGADLTTGEHGLRLVLAGGLREHRTGPRVGVSGAGGDATLYPWRYWLPDEPTVSAYRPASPRRRRGTAD